MLAVGKNLSLAVRFFIAYALFGVSLFSVSKAEITAESVLGEYWKDPLFGVVAGEVSITFELLQYGVIPHRINTLPNKRVQVIFKNNDTEMHIMAFAQNPSALLSDEQFLSSVDDVYSHAKEKVKYIGNHQHTDASISNSKKFIKTIEDLPLVVIKPRESKEVIIKFNGSNSVKVFCVLDGHIDRGYISKIIFDV